jgi:hypothetical protein
VLHQNTLPYSTRFILVCLVDKRFTKRYSTLAILIIDRAYAKQWNVIRPPPSLYIAYKCTDDPSQYTGILHTHPSRTSYREKALRRIHYAKRWNDIRRSLQHTVRHQNTLTYSTRTLLVCLVEERLTEEHNICHFDGQQSIRKMECYTPLSIAHGAPSERADILHTHSSRTSYREKALRSIQYTCDSDS